MDRSVDSLAGACEWSLWVRFGCVVCDKRRSVATIVVAEAGKGTKTNRRVKRYVLCGCCTKELNIQEEAGQIVPRSSLLRCNYV